MGAELPSEPGVKSSEGSIHVYIDQKRESLTLSCSTEAFARIREMILREAASALPVDDTGRVSTIEILDLTQFSHADRGWRNSLVLVGCGLTCVVILLVFFAGVFRIVTWVGQ